MVFVSLFTIFFSFLDVGLETEFIYLMILSHLGSLDDVTKLFDCRLEALLRRDCLGHLRFFSISLTRLSTCLPLG